MIIEAHIIEIIILFIFITIFILTLKNKKFDEDKNFIFSLLISISSIIIFSAIQILSNQENEDLNELLYEQSKFNWKHLSFAIIVIFNLFALFLNIAKSINKNTLTVITAFFQILVIILFAAVFVIGQMFFLM